MNWEHIDRYAKSLIKEAGHKIRNSFSTRIDIDTKSNANDFVTNIDREIEQFFIGRIQKDFPGHQIFGEEGFGDAVKTLGGVTWNDERLPQLEVVPVKDAIIGINARWVAPNRYVDNEKIIGLILECRGTRSYGTAAIELAYVASGRLDSYISMRLSPWDIAGGLVIAQEVGAIVTNFDGEMPQLLEQESCIVARPGLHDDILRNYIRLKK